jgi:hypothetical protein
MVLEYVHGCKQTNLHHVQTNGMKLKHKLSAIMINKISSQARRNRSSDKITAEIRRMVKGPR